jgi:hypothetical protein
MLMEKIVLLVLPMLLTAIEHTSVIWAPGERPVTSNVSLSSRHVLCLIKASLSDMVELS